MRGGADGKPPGTVRAVLLERHVFDRKRRLVAYGRGLWGDHGRTEVKMWLTGELTAELGEGAKILSRSRSEKGVRDPLVAMEIAFKIWDEYLEEVWIAAEPLRDKHSLRGG